jgi:hypothetical protein
MIASSNILKEDPRQPSTRVSAILRPIISATGIALLLSATATLATPLTISGMTEIGSVELSFSENSTDPFLIGYDEVKLRFDYNYDPDKARNWNDWWQNGVGAGAFAGEAESVKNNSFDITTLYRSQDEVILYCLDIFNGLETKGFVEYVVYALDDAETGAPTTTTEITPAKTVARGPWWKPKEKTIPGVSVTGDINNVLDFLGALNDVLAETEYWVKEDDGDDGWVQYGTYSFGDRNWLNPANSFMSGAIQVGIWESLYDDDMDINSGHFSVKGLDDDGELLLTEAFGRMASSDPLDSSQVLLFQPVTGGQTLIGDPVKVPAPGTLALLLSGLFLVRKVRRGSH